MQGLKETASVCTRQTNILLGRKAAHQELKLMTSFHPPLPSDEFCTHKSAVRQLQCFCQVMQVRNVSIAGGHEIAPFHTNLDLWSISTLNGRSVGVSVGLIVCTSCDDAAPALTDSKVIVDFCCSTISSQPNSMYRSWTTGRWKQSSWSNKHVQSLAEKYQYFP